MEHLKPCPFCGREARISYGNDNGDLFVIAMCSSCGIRTPKFYYKNGELSEGEMMVAKRWNRRVE